MLRALRRWGAAEPLAHVLVDRFVKAERENIKAGLPPGDARQQVEKDWLMLEPERTTVHAEITGTLGAPSRPDPADYFRS